MTEAKAYVQAFIMDQMLPSPSFNIPSIGTPHHGMEEDQMIDRSAMAKQEQSKSQDYHGKFYNSSGKTSIQFEAFQDRFLQTF